MAIEFRRRFPVDDGELSALHGRAFGGDDIADRLGGDRDRAGVVRPWARRLERHALTWVGAFDSERIVGFVQVVWDGGAHALLLDTVVDPERQQHGIGAELVRVATEEARAAGCEWLHVDFEPHLEHFYLDKCGFRPTPAGLIALR